MATKKISELPLITTLSGSQVDGGSVLPVVVGGTTNQISVENFSRFATAYSATTASNTFSGNQNITGNVSITGVETVTGTLNVVGGGSVSGDFSVGGKLTVQELHTEVTSASILFESGSTILGNTADDTHTVTGTILLNGQALGTGQLNAYTGSQNVINSSVDSHILKQAIQTGSQNLVNLGISTYTGSQNVINNSVDSHILKQAIQTGSQNLVNLGISTYTGSQNIINTSVDSHILKQAIQTGSQDLVNLAISTATGSLIGITNGLMAFTAALDNTYATDAQLYPILQATRSLELLTGSLVGITNGLMAFTAALDSTYATDAQLYQLYQATASIQSFTSSQDTRNFTISQITSSIDAHILKQAIQTGSQDLVNLGISTYTGSQNVINNSVDVHILKQAAQTGSQDLVNLAISTYTGSQNTINNSVDSHILKQAIQTGSQDLVNLGISTYTGSQNTINNSVDAHILGVATYTGSNELWKAGVRGEVNGLEAYTASLKGAIEVSGQNVNVLGMITAQQFNVTYVSSSVMYQSGSTKFGNSSDDKHEFTGSAAITGNTTIGNATAATNVLLTLNGVSGKASRIQFQNSGTDQWLLGAGAASESDAFELYNASGTIAMSVAKSTSGVAFAGPVTASAARFNNIIRTTPNGVANYFADYAYNGVTYNFDSAETSDNINYVINSGNFTSNGAFIWKTSLSGATAKERLKLSSNGQLSNTVSGSNGQFILYQQQASYNTDAMSYFHNNANASTGWNFLKMFSGYPDNTQDVEFVFRGDGNAYADTGWTTPASDYAEYFESLNGEALPVGSTVVLVGNKIRVATESDTNIIGVIRPKGAALFLGNNEAQKWNGKYLKDDYGAYILNENGHRTLNPNYDSTITYVSRESRVEWNVVGLIGQVPITKGQPVNSNWIKMKDISSNVEEWLIK